MRDDRPDGIERLLTAALIAVITLLAVVQGLQAFGALS